MKKLAGVIAPVLVGALLIPVPAASADVVAADCADDTAPGVECTMPETPICSPEIRAAYDKGMWEIIQIEEHWFQVAKKRKAEIRRLRAEIRRLKARG